MLFVYVELFFNTPTSILDLHTDSQYRYRAPIIDTGFCVALRIDVQYRYRTSIIELEFDYSHTMPIINSGYPDLPSIDTGYAEIDVTSIDIGRTQHRYWASDIDLV